MRAAAPTLQDKAGGAMAVRGDGAVGHVIGRGLLKYALDQHLV